MYIFRACDNSSPMILVVKDCKQEFYISISWRGLPNRFTEIPTSPRVGEIHRHTLTNSGAARLNWRHRIIFAQFICIPAGFKTNRKNIFPYHQKQLIDPVALIHSWKDLAAWISKTTFNQLMFTCLLSNNWI